MVRGASPPRAVLAVTAVLTAGAPALAQDGYFFGVTVKNGHPWADPVTTEEADAARWLRGHSGPDDVVATNWHGSLSFWLNAYSERRTLVGSWNYAPRALDESKRLNVNAAYVPFWDSELLAANDAAIYEPTAQRIAWLRARGVRWIFVLRTFRQESSTLVDYASQRWTTSGVAIYQLPD
jgi:hypothetical protein